MPEVSAAPAQPSGQGPSVGKASAPTQTTPSSSGGSAVGKPYFEYEWEDGEKESFATEEEHRKAWREGRLRYKNYTQKTQALAQQRKAFEKQQQELQTVAAEAKKLHGQWKPVDEWLNSRPDVRDYIVKNMKNPSPEAIAEQVKAPISKELQETKSQLQQLMEWKQQRESKERKTAMYDHLGKQYEDFNSDDIEDELTKFMEIPEEDTQRAIAELIYWARKGRSVPKKVGETQVAGPQPTARKMPPVPTGKRTGEAAETEYKSVQEAAEAYKRKHPD